MIHIFILYSRCSHWSSTIISAGVVLRIGLRVDGRPIVGGQQEELGYKEDLKKETSKPKRAVPFGMAIYGTQLGLGTAYPSILKGGYKRTLVAHPKYWLEGSAVKISPRSLSVFSKSLSADLKFPSISLDTP